MNNFRKDIVNMIIPHAKENEKIILLVSDMGFGAIDNFRKEFPNRVYNVGIMEQGAIGIAAGMAMTGLIPIFYSIVNFIVFRSIEQVRNDVILQKQNVKFISTGANDYFKFLGPSHCCGNDDVKLMNMVNMPVYDPYLKNDTDFDKMVNEWITSPQAGYIRV